MEDLYKKLAAKHNMPIYALKVLLEAPFRMMSDEFEKRSLKNFNFPYLGKIALSEGKKQWVRENILKDGVQSNTTDSSGVEEPDVQE